VQDFIEEIEDDLGLPDVKPKVPSVPVAIQGSPLTSRNVADFGAYQTIVFVGTEAPQQLVGYDNLRYRVTIRCLFTGTSAPTNPPASIWVGTSAQLQASAIQGFRFFSGQPELKVENNQAVWIAPDGTNPVTVSVMIERYEGSPGGRQVIDQGSTVG
jgi:hypothetical protein